MSSSAAAVEQVGAAASRRRPVLVGAWLLPATMVVSGVLTYAFLVLAARRLGTTAYGHVGVLWAAIFIAAIVVFRPIEQTASRTIADRLARGGEAVTVLRSLAAIVGAIVVLAAIGLGLGWNLLRDRVFHGDEFLTVSFVAGVAAYGAAYVVRGVVGGVRWFAGYGLGLIADGVVRLAVAAPLLVVASEHLAAAALVAAGAGGAILPLALGRRRLKDLAVGGAAPRFHAGAAIAFAAPASIIAAADQALVNGGPLLVIAAGGRDASRTAGIVFAATMLVRAPVYVFQGLAASLLPNLTRLHATRDRARFAWALRRTLLVLGAAGAAIAVGAAAAGPAAMRLYGSGFAASRLDLALLGIGVGCYLGAATLSQALLSFDACAPAAVAWTASAALYVGTFAAAPGGALHRVALAFAIATAAALAGTAALVARGPADAIRAAAE